MVSGAGILIVLLTLTLSLKGEGVDLRFCVGI